MKNTLSARQKHILQFILNFRGETGFPPTVRDIQHAENPPISSTSVVDYNLRALEEHGVIKRGRGLSRSIELVEEKVAELVRKGELQVSRIASSRAVRLIPLAETPIAAGTPIPVLESLQVGGNATMLEVDHSILGRWAERAHELYALRVKGQSMIDALIADQDIVILAPQATAHEREMVAIWLKREQETTLKYFHREDGNRVRLQPANTTMDPIYTTADNVEIMGRVVGVLRCCD